MLVDVAEPKKNPFLKSNYISNRRPLGHSFFETLPDSHHDGESTAVA